ncbi:MAG: hypothetical protein KJ697_04245 [Nanoarchaeota archaeon]|nr:hypothetical protein [Nanoarchaeota archaeon]
MKGSVVLEVASMAIIAVVVIFVLYNLLVAEPSSVKAPSDNYQNIECESSDDCIGNKNGPVCLEAGVPIPTVFCGCLENSNCGAGCRADNRCL